MERVSPLLQVQFPHAESFRKVFISICIGIEEDLVSHIDPKEGQVGFDLIRKGMTNPCLVMISGLRFDWVYLDFRHVKFLSPRRIQ